MIPGVYMFKDYRVVRHADTFTDDAGTQHDEAHFALHIAYYDDDRVTMKPKAISHEPVSVITDNPIEMLPLLDRFREAIDRPALNFTDYYMDGAE